MIDINISKVCKSFGFDLVLNNIDITVQKGEKVGLIGTNGSGKSTILKIIAGQESIDSGSFSIRNNISIGYLSQIPEEKDIIVKDYINSAFKEIIELKEKLERYEDKLLTEDYKVITKYMNLQEKFISLGGYEYETKIQKILPVFNITEEILNRNFNTLSGGEKTIISLIRLLLQEPDVLLLDEPTNNLDIDAIEWLEEFLINFNNTVIVVSHDRHFLNKVCTHIADIDYNKIKLYIGNYDFWYESSQLALKQMKEANKKKEEKIKELQLFIARFSANASKSKQATSRKKMLEKIELDEIVPSSRKYPYIDFKIEKPAGKEILTVNKLCKTIDGKRILNKISFTVLKGDKIAFVGSDNIAKTTLFKILMREMKADSGEITFGKTIVKSYYPQDNTEYFKEDETIMKWIGHYYNIDDETVLRGFLGRMLFSGDDVFKRVPVLSGGEKARCMLSKCMLEAPNFLILDEPTNHLDLESITSLNNGLMRFEGEILFASHDHQFIQTVANRIIEIKDDGTIIDRRMTYDQYLEEKKGK